MYDKVFIASESTSGSSKREWQRTAHLVLIEFFFSSSSDIQRRALSLLFHLACAAYRGRLILISDGFFGHSRSLLKEVAERRHLRLKGVNNIRMIIYSLFTLSFSAEWIVEFVEVDKHPVL